LSNDCKTNDLRWMHLCTHLEWDHCELLNKLFNAFQLVQREQNCLGGLKITLLSLNFISQINLLDFWWTYYVSCHFVDGCVIKMNAAVPRGKWNNANFHLVQTMTSYTSLIIVSTHSVCVNLSCNGLEWTLWVNSTLSSFNCRCGTLEIVSDSCYSRHCVNYASKPILVHCKLKPNCYKNSFQKHVNTELHVLMA